LLHPVKITLGHNKDISIQIEQLNQLSFDIQQLSPETIIITAVPEVFSRYPIELETLFNVLLYQDQISYDSILDQLRATKACKAAIKAGDRLSLPQMQQLLDDGMTKVDGMFVCQHGRPFWIQIPRSHIDKMVDR
jgi:DNA mismatch repair protein MutL